MSGARARIDPTEFKPVSPGFKFICFLVISLCFLVWLKVNLKIDSIGLSVSIYIVGSILGTIGGFIGSSIGKFIYESIGAVSIYEKGVMDIFLRKIGMKVGPGLVGCLLGSFLGLYFIMRFFG